MSDSIKLSPKHGLNPSMICCVYCDSCIEIALMGKMKPIIDKYGRTIDSDRS